MPTLTRLHPMDLYRTLDDEPGACLVVLTSESCGACRAMRRALAALPYPGFPLRVLEVDAGAHRGVVEEHGAFHLPALYLYQGGELHGEVQAPPRTDALLEAIRAVAARPSQERDTDPTPPAHGGRGALSRPARPGSARRDP